MEKRREELELWRQRTGRTPMKRLSYLLPCAQNPTPSVPTITKSSLNSQSVYHQRSRGMKLTSRPGSVVKPSRSILTPLNGGTRRCGPTQDSLQRAAAMKEQFQRDIDDTVAEILAEEEAGRQSEQQPEMEAHQSDQVAMALHFEGTEDSSLREPSSPQKSSEISISRKKRRSSAFYVDEELAFNSSKICYTTVYHSEQRRNSRRRRSRYSCLDSCPPEGRGDEAGERKGLLYLTPVRRSTRSRRSLSAHPRVDAGPYFDSPGQAEGTEGYQGVRVIPNHALITNTEN